MNNILRGTDPSEQGLVPLNFQYKQTAKMEVFGQYVAIIIQSVKLADFVALDEHIPAMVWAFAKFDPTSDQVAVEVADCIKHAHDMLNTAERAKFFLSMKALQNFCNPPTSIHTGQRTSHVTRSLCSKVLSILQRHIQG